MLPHGECYFNRSHASNCTSTRPKKGVSQINFDSSPHFANKTETLDSMDVLKQLFESNQLVAHVEESFKLAEISSAYAKSASGHVVGKIVVVA